MGTDAEDGGSHCAWCPPAHKEAMRLARMHVPMQAAASSTHEHACKGADRN